MFHFHSPRQSLSTRCFIGFGVILLPFLLAAALGLFYLLPSLVDPLNNSVKVVTNEVHPMLHLQEDLLRATKSVNDYLGNGNPGASMLFIQQSRRVGLYFQKIALAPFTNGQGREQIDSARSQWQQAKQLGEALLRSHDPSINPQTARQIESFNAHIDLSEYLLDQAHEIFVRNIGAYRMQAQNTRVHIFLITFGVFVLALAIALFVTIALVRTVLAGIDTLGQGVMRLASGEYSYRVAKVHDDELGMLATAFNAMATKLEENQNALYELTIRDGLTGLYNHRTFYTLLAEELARSQRSNRPVSLLMLDIDHFKHVNDTYGHQAGDAILRGLSELLGQQLRAIDRVCRYGGEEIAVILPEIDPDTASSIAERLRTSVETHLFEVNTTIHITVSIGVASSPTDGDSVDTLVAAADAALYVAKRSGRNRVSIIFSPCVQV